MRTSLSLWRPLRGPAGATKYLEMYQWKTKGGLINLNIEQKYIQYMYVLLPMLVVKMTVFPKMAGSYSILFSQPYSMLI